MAGMTEEELRQLLASKIQNSIGYQGGRLSFERQKAQRYYTGDLFGNEIEGRSQVVSRDVAEAIDGMMPSLMKIFASGDEIVRFEPDRPESEQQAKQATDYVNWIWTKQNNGFDVFYTWFKTALLDKNGVVKIWWEEKVSHDKESYEGLTDDEFFGLVSDPDLELLEHSEYDDPDPVPPPPPTAGTPQAGAPGAPPGPLSPPAAPNQMPGDGSMAAAFPNGNLGSIANGANQLANIGQQPGRLHDAVFRRVKDMSQVKVQALPPDEFLIDRRAVSLDEVPFTCHRRKSTADELIELFPDKEEEILAIPRGDEEEYSLERLTRFYPEDENPYRNDTANDPLMREIWIAECYIRADVDGDGSAELRQVTVAGTGNYVGTILSNEEVDDHPWASVTPIPQPHKFFGQSVADLTEDLQLIKSTIMRQMLDNLYVANTPQIGAVEGKVNLDDLLNRKPGGIVRLKSPDAIVPIENPVILNEAMEALSYFDSVREGRTGVQRFATGPGADSINDAYTETATGVNLVENSSQERIELIARIFAETGVKRAFRRILELVCKHQEKPKVIKLRGEWVEMDPREWNAQMEMSVHVGLGTGNKQQQIGAVMQMLGVTEKLLAFQGNQLGGMVPPEKLFNQLSKFIEAIGLRSPEAYYSDPSKNPLPPPKPDPKVQQQQQLTQIKAQESQQQMQLEREKSAQEMQIKQMEAQMDMRLQMQKLQFEMEKMRGELAMRQQEHQMTLAHDQQASQIQLQGEMRRQEYEDERAEVELQHAKAAGDQKLEMNEAAHTQKLAQAKQAAKAKPKGKAD